MTVADQPRRLMASELTTEARIDRSRRLRFSFDGNEHEGFAGDTLASALLANGQSIFARSFKYHRARGVFATGEEEPNALVQLLDDDNRLAEPNLKATQILLREGLRAKSQNRFPSLRFDLGALASFFSPLLIAGFYYKTFMFPSKAWRFYEYFIRRAAGLGKAPQVGATAPQAGATAPQAGDDGFYEWNHAYPDVLIVGGGLAGLEAAEALSAHPLLRVMLVEQDVEFGGSLLHSDGDVRVDGLRVAESLEARLARLRGRENMTLLSHTCASGYYDANFVTAFEQVEASYRDRDKPRQRFWRIRAGYVLLATGASERGAVFVNNDLPGVMLADSIRAYIRRYAVLPGREAVIFTNNDNGYRSALALHEAGASVQIVDWRRDARSELTELARKRGITIYKNSAVVAAEATSFGVRQLAGVRVVERLRDDSLVSTSLASTSLVGTFPVSTSIASTSIASSRELSCTLLGISGGFVPRLHLFSQAGGGLRFDRASNCSVPDVGLDEKTGKIVYRADKTANFRCYLAGSITGTASFSDAQAQGFNAAEAILQSMQKDPLTTKRLSANGKGAGKNQGNANKGNANKGNANKTSELKACATEPLTPSLCLVGKNKGDNGNSQMGNSQVRGKFAFVDLQNDSTEADIRLAIREGYRSLEHVKRYTTTGMATDQGKTANANAIAIVADALETPIEELGTTTYRPPYSPQSFGAFVGPHRGKLFHPVRQTPMHRAHVADGAFFEDVGDWKKPWFYPLGKDGSSETLVQACQRESLAVRTSAGLLDGTTLGKIDLRGADALWLLNMLYTNSWDNLKVGRCRYGVMLTEAGMIFDDGVTARVGKDHYYMTTTTGGAARVLTWIEEWLQTEWPNRKVYATSVTEQWAVCVVGGPNARALLQPLCDDDLSASALKFMTFKEMRVAGIRARVFRVSFSGESAFEINVPSRYGESLWRALSQQGLDYDLVKYGTEAAHLLRGEKGFIIPGQDTDGTVTPYDANLGWLVDKDKEDFFGKRSLACEDLARAGRKQLVGLLTGDPRLTLDEGTHLLEDYENVSRKSLRARRLKPIRTIGHVTSSYYSPNLQKSIAMALVSDGLSRKGSTIYALTAKGCVATRVVSSVFFDPKGTRMRC